MIPFNKPDIKMKNIALILNYLLEMNLENYFIHKFNQYNCLEHSFFSSNARTSLYTIYKTMNTKRKKVIVSPLTCASAILPLVCAGFEPYFIDIDPRTFNINPESLPPKKHTKNIAAIQLIHLGGLPCDIDSFKDYAEDNNIYMVEDCAQALGAEYKGKKVGSNSFASAFSLPKTLFGIGGVTTYKNRKYLEKAQKFNETLEKMSFPYFLYRIIRYYIESYRGNPVSDRIYDIFMNLRKINPKAKKILLGATSCYTFKKMIKKPNKWALAHSFNQLSEIDYLINKRIENAHELRKMTSENSRIELQIFDKDYKHSYTRFMIKTPIKTKKLNKLLLEKSIEAHHLSQKHGTIYQDKISHLPQFRKYNSLKKCEIYNEIHDYLVSIPLSPNLSSKTIFRMGRILNEII